jgi:hypothetical protein
MIQLMRTNELPATAPAVRRQVQAGLWTFFAGALALFFGLVGQLQLQAQQSAAATLADRFPDWPTWFVPESPAGYTAALMMVCWGVWSLGRGLRLAREGAAAR